MASQKVGNQHSVHGSIPACAELRQAGLTTNGKSNSYGVSHPFALRYRRAKGTFYEVIEADCDA